MRPGTRARPTRPGPVPTLSLPRPGRRANLLVLTLLGVVLLPWQASLWAGLSRRPGRRYGADPFGWSVWTAHSGMPNYGSGQNVPGQWPLPWKPQEVIKEVEVGRGQARFRTEGVGAFPLGGFGQRGGSTPTRTRGAAGIGPGPDRPADARTPEPTLPAGPGTSQVDTLRQDALNPDPNRQRNDLQRFGQPAPPAAGAWAPAWSFRPYSLTTATGRPAWAMPAGNVWRPVALPPGRP